MRIEADAMERVRTRQAIEVAEELLTAEMSVSGMMEHLSLRTHRDYLRRLWEELGNDEGIKKTERIERVKR